MPTTGALPRFILLYAALYAAYGVASPFLPAFVSSRGLAPDELGVVLAAGTTVRIIAGPLAGRAGDLLRALRAVLAACLIAAATIVTGYLPAASFGAFLLLSLLHAAALAPAGVLADALAVSASRSPARPFEYGWVRGTGSAAFIAGLIFSGHAVAVSGLETIIGLQAMLLGAAALAAMLVPEIAHPPRAEGEVRRPAGGVLLLLRIPTFRNLVLAAALVLGSHAMNDAFSMIRWREAGIDAGTASLLWAESVAAEVLIFFLAGPWLIARLTPAGAIALAALAGLLRWTVLAQTTEVAAVALVQPLHGITFALLHLACMRVLAQVVPPGLEGTAQAIYGTLGVGAATALLTLVSGGLYARIGAQGFWVMAALCALALPVIWRLRTPAAS
jgi:MFS transporter, PPP family, 3-phenylpropionic acid transporter